MWRNVIFVFIGSIFEKFRSWEWGYPPNTHCEKPWNVTTHAFNYLRICRCILRYDDILTQVQSDISIYAGCYARWAMEHLYPVSFVYRVFCFHFPLHLFIFINVRCICRYIYIYIYVFHSCVPVWDIQYQLFLLTIEL